MSKKPNEHYIVINPGRGPSLYPAQHDSQRKALDEAERLARANPGQEFIVYQSFCSLKKSDIVYTSLSPAFDDEIPF